MSNEIEQIIEDVEEKDLIESEVEVSEETEVTEQQEQPLSNAVLDVLLGEAKKKNEAEEEDEKSEEDAEEVEEDEDEELDEAKAKSEDAHEDEESDEVEEDEEEDEESTKKVEEDDEEEVEEEDDEELEEGAHEDEDEEEVEEGEHSDEDEEKAEDAHEDEAEEEEESVELPEVQTKAGYLAASFDTIKGMKKTELVSAYKAVNMSEEEDEVEVPKTKADIINAMYGQLKAMKKDDLVASYDMIKASHCTTEETEADHFAADLKVLAETDQELTEDFKAKASILFEAAVTNKVNTIKENLEAQYAEDLVEEVTYVRESLVEKIDDYLAYVVESWIEENQEFVDNKLRTEITENFMKALQSTFTEHYIEVPESKVDLVDELSEQVTEVKESLANAEAEKSELASQVETLQREKIISEASSDLASTQAEKLSSLVEESDYVDAETFEAKVATIKEGFFKESTETEVLNESETSDSATTEVKTIVEGEVDPQAKLPKDMAKYVSHLSRFK